MPGIDLTPHWNVAGTRWGVLLVCVMLGMTMAALLLRWRASSDKARLFAHDFGARTLGWWIIVLVYTPGVLAGGVILLALFGVTALVAWLEFARLKPDAPLRAIDLAWAAPLVALHCLALVGRAHVRVIVVQAVVMAVVALATLLQGRQRWLERTAWRWLGWLTCVLPLTAAALLALRFGTGWLAFTMIVVQAGDVLQYLAGKRFGRHPLAPKLSPRKTWEGLLGGVLGTAVLGAMLSPIIHRGAWAGFGFGLAVALAGSAAGLVMSAAKRSHGMKDFGAWLPGHGGLMDRLDSLCGAAAFVFLWLAR